LRPDDARVSDVIAEIGHRDRRLALTGLAESRALYVLPFNSRTVIGVEVSRQPRQSASPCGTPSPTKSDGTSVRLAIA